MFDQDYYKDMIQQVWFAGKPRCPTIPCSCKILLFFQLAGPSLDAVEINFCFTIIYVMYIIKNTFKDYSGKTSSILTGIARPGI